jgi:hypothetical protein
MHVGNVSAAPAGREMPPGKDDRAKFAASLQKESLR